MRWDDVLLVTSDAVMADITLTGIYGDSVRLKGSQAHTVPGLEYTLVSDVEGEVFEPIVVQWDQYASTLEDLIAGERALRHLFDQELQVTIGGVPMFCEFIDGVELEAPTGDNCYARAVRFSFHPIREALQRS
jgi:hypothetical protein